MIRKLLTFIVALFIMFTISSCDVYTYATTQDDIYTETSVDIVRSNVSFDVIIQYGTPYYRDGVLLYYTYRDLYYYPYFYNDYWYVRAYRRPFVHFDHRPYFRPHKYDYKFSPGHYRGFDRPKNPNIYYNRRPNTPRNTLDVQRRPNNVRPDIQPNKPNNDRVQPNRPNVNREQPTRPNNNRVQPNRQQPTRQVTPNRTQPQRNGGQRSGGGRR